MFIPESLLKSSQKKIQLKESEVIYCLVDVVHDVSHVLVRVARLTLN